MASTTKSWQMDRLIGRQTSVPSQVLFEQTTKITGWPLLRQIMPSKQFKSNDATKLRRSY